ncbi:MAG: hypothetical protein QXW70_03595 [Candidatus Anstonellales archaeon]
MKNGELFVFSTFFLLLIIGCINQQTSLQTQSTATEGGPSNNPPSQTSSTSQSSDISGEPKSTQTEELQLPSPSKIEECEISDKRDTCYYLKATELNSPAICINIVYGPQKAQCLYDTITVADDCLRYKELLQDYSESCPKKSQPG